MTLFLEPARFNAVCGSGAGGLSDRLGAAFDLVFPGSGNGCVNHWIEVDVVVHAGNPFLAAMACWMATRAGYSVALLPASAPDDWAYDLAATPEFLSVVRSASGLDCQDLDPASVCMSMLLKATENTVRLPHGTFGVSGRAAGPDVLPLVLRSDRDFRHSDEIFDDGFGFSWGFRAGTYLCKDINPGNSGSLAVFCKRLVLTSAAVSFADGGACEDEYGQRINWGHDLVFAAGSAAAMPSSGENAAKLALETVLSVSRLF